MTSAPSPGGADPAAAAPLLAAVEVYNTFLDQLVATEAARKDSLQARGTGIITSAGVLGTLFFGFVTTFGLNSTHGLPSATHGLVVATVALFAAAAGCGVISNFAARHDDVDIECLCSQVDAPGSDPAAATRAVAKFKLRIVEKAQRHNKLRAWVLTVALALEAMGAAALAWAVGTALKYRAY